MLVSETSPVAGKHWSEELVAELEQRIVSASTDAVKLEGVRARARDASLSEDERGLMRHEARLLEERLAGVAQRVDAYRGMAKKLPQGSRVREKVDTLVRILERSARVENAAT